MGRAMLLTSAGAVILLGILQLGIQNQRSGIAQNAAIDAYEVQIRNKAFTASQLTMERINESSGAWHPTKDNPWIQEIDGDSISLYYDLMESSATGSFSMLEDDTVQIYAKSWFKNPTTGQRKDINIITSYVKTAMHFVPEFKSAMSFAVDADDFNFSADGSALVSGNDANGVCPSKPAITVRDSDSAAKVQDDSSHLESDSLDIEVDSTLSYQPVDELVARLSELSSVVQVEGSYKDDLGTPENPGIFFVENSAKLTGGISEGYGIMVIRSGGELEYEGELTVAGNFTFNGLVIFENAYNMTGSGTPKINGSVLVGKADETSNEVLDVNLTGTIDIQYDCTSEKYAQLAAAQSLNQNRYKRLSTYE